MIYLLGFKSNILFEVWRIHYNAVLIRLSHKILSSNENSTKYNNIAVQRTSDLKTTVLQKNS